MLSLWWTQNWSGLRKGVIDNGLERASGGTSLIDVLDKGIVVDAWVRISLVGIDREALVRNSRM